MCSNYRPVTKFDPLLKFVGVVREMCGPPAWRPDGSTRGGRLRQQGDRAARCRSGAIATARTEDDQRQGRGATCAAERARLVLNPSRSDVAAFNWGDVLPLSPAFLLCAHIAT